MAKYEPHLGTVQETLLIPLYARAVDHREQQSVLGDERAEEIASSLDYDFTRFDGLPSLSGVLLRSLLFDHWVRDFLAKAPDATVVEIGAGLNTRYERVDNGRSRWFELDLPDVIELRRRHFSDSSRRTMLGVSVTDRAWPVDVVSHSQGPYLLVAEAVLPFLDEPEARGVFDLLAEHFPGALLALDTAGPGFFDNQDEHDALSKVQARMNWYCPDPADLADWLPGLKVMASHAVTDLPTPVMNQLPQRYQELVAAISAQHLPQVDGYRLNLVRLP
ncbi:class I SAM-dependent methyltransferase [Streptomyces sp. Z26]|uniref:class I SAM-dependent methyltransferase n=1 Tax=Streptomyces sp. Z26 TaxID=2500177 RepID=UPI000EF14A91|nr:class I SAM-dependent methyltransferase [Streptomyces sp. Z26]RLL67603.1 class I SAM-dependent methyltransferase [Streptomyces sp. Z26]